ncbi:MAG: hypothetical protein J2P40_05770 [Candidatus Dormibacteraeota bacterium]|nr:hypothetical protein [Candidatus Dormibacteraeota bacterium]MBO0760763.1 hypothetical protein [Candidatus Dormibacteraeota bacterium]
MPGLYDIIADLRREHQTPAASRTLDLIVSELGRTQDNLREALARLGSQAIPTGGQSVLDELDARARAERVDDLEVPWSRADLRAAAEPVDASQTGIALVMGATALVGVLLSAAAILFGLNTILHWF